MANKISEEYLRNLGFKRRPFEDQGSYVYTKFAFNKLGKFEVWVDLADNGLVLFIHRIWGLTADIHNNSPVYQGKLNKKNLNTLLSKL